MNLLFVCSQNKRRSLTAETMFDGVNGYRVRSAGTEKNARIKVTAGMIGWADVIFCFEKKHLRRLQERYAQELREKKVITMNVPDEYEYMDEELQEILRGFVEMPDATTKELGQEIMVGGLRFKSNVLMAPLAGYTCFPFRLMVERLGAGSAYTEMVSSDGLKYNDRATAKLLYTDDREKLKCVQLLGSIPAVFERAAKSERLERFDVIDINMGCPVPNVIKAGEGSALLEDLPRASKIIEACKRSGKVVSVKCRVGLNRQKIVIEEFARMCEQSGADMITVHGRTRDMMYDGEPLYDSIKKAKQSVKIPVFANGGIDSKASALEMMEKTGADGVMLARYGFENPLIFAELTGTPCNDTKYSLLMEQLEIAEECYDELYVLSYVKKLASYFMKKLPGTKRYKLALYRCGSISELRTILGEIFAAADGR